MNLTQFHRYIDELPRVIGIGQMRHNARSQATVRREMGSDINAACGQLRLRSIAK